MNDADADIAESSFAGRRRDQRIAVFETIGCALASLRRLDSVWYDDDIRTIITTVRSTLSVAQSKIRKRIDEAFVAERKQV